MTKQTKSEQAMDAVVEQRMVAITEAFQRAFPDGLPKEAQAAMFRAVRMDAQETMARQGR